MSSNTPYGQAVNAYGATAAATDQRTLEGQILLRAATRMDLLCQQLEKPEGALAEHVLETMDYNQKLWTVFVNDTMNPEHPLPDTIKNNIANLAVFVFGRTREVLIEPTPEKIRPLIEINRNIAAGLMKRAAAQPSADAVPTTPPLSSSTDSSV